jgi:hypothetical protein
MITSKIHGAHNIRSAVTFPFMGISFIFVPQPRSGLGHLLVEVSRSHHPYPCLQQDLNTWSQQSGACRSTLWTSTTEFIDVSYSKMFTRNWLIHTHFNVFICGLFKYSVSGLFLYRQNETRLVSDEMQRMWKHLWCNLGYRPSFCVYGCREIIAQQISDRIASVEASVWTGSFSMRCRRATLFTAVFRATCWK